MWLDPFELGFYRFQFVFRHKQFYLFEPIKLFNSFMLK